MGVEAEILTQPQQVHYFCTDFSFEKGNFTSLFLLNSSTLASYFRPDENMTFCRDGVI